MGLDERFDTKPKKNEEASLVLITSSNVLLTTYFTSSQAYRCDREKRIRYIFVLTRHQCTLRVHHFTVMETVRASKTL